MAEFTLVTRGHKRCARRQRNRYNDPVRFDSMRETAVECNKDNVQAVYTAVLEKQRAINSTPFISSFHDILQSIAIQLGSPVATIVCYGIGSISDSACSQHQLAVLLDMRDFLQSQKVFVYDPVLNRSDQEVLERLGVELLQTNEHCRRRVSDLTIFYMPHCGMAMYNNLLWANWKPSLLSSLVLIGNCFSSCYWERLSANDLESTAYYIHTILRHCQEISFPSNYPESNVFNDTAVHLFPHDQLPAIDDQVWLDCQEPVLNCMDQEMII